MTFTHTLLSWIGFSLIALTLIFSPWLFGAWEMWYFWPFALLLFLATLVLGIRFFLFGVAPRGDRPHTPYRQLVPLCPSAGGNGNGVEPAAGRRDVRWLVLGMLPFLIYAFIRFLQAPVFMDAERSFLLFLTPVLLGIHILFGFNRRQRQLLLGTVAGNLSMLGLYGLATYTFGGDGRVLWRQGFEQYAGRATGSYFCPDHFAGIMELAICIGLGFVTARNRGLIWKLWGAGLMVMGTLGVIASKSRGGGLTLVVIAVAALIWGLGQWPPRRRWLIRSITLGVLLFAAILFWNSQHPYVSRFKSYGAWQRIDRIAEPEGRQAIREDALRTSRGRMYGGAWRAWQSAPVWGIGPGMHQHLWFHFGPSPDGDREAGIWPTLRNTHFHSFEVHSDWLQLLEEYGIIGFTLFTLPALALGLMLLIRLRRESRRCRNENWDTPEGEAHDRILAGFLAWVTMGFHSLGDFNLHMPATTWMLAALLALALSRPARVSCPKP